MAIERKYDVFISYSRKDYLDENGNEIEGNIVTKVKDTLEKAGISYWIDKDGIYLGDQYMTEIADAIADSDILLFLSSVNSNASEWTSGEIGTAHLYKKKIIPFRLDESPYARSIIVKISSLHYIDYYSNEDKALLELIKSIKAYKEELQEKKKAEEELRRKKLQEEEEKKRKLEEEKKRKQTKDEIKRLAADHKLHSTQQGVILQQLIEKNIAIGNNTKTCPVCKKVSSIEATYCDKCGFQFPSLYAVDGKDSYAFDKKVLSVSKANHDSLLLLSDENERLRNTIVEKEISLDETKKKCLDYQKSIEEIKSLLASKDAEIEELKKTSSQASEYYLIQVIQLEEEKKDLQDKLKKTEAELDELKGQLKQKENELVLYQGKSSSLSKELNDAKERVAAHEKRLDKQKQESLGRIEKLQQENAKLTKRFEQSEQEQKQVERVYREAQERIKDLEGKLAQLESLVAHADLYDFVLLSPGKNQYDVAKFVQVKFNFNISLKEAYDLVESAPNAILVAGITMKEAEELAKSLNKFGASYKITPHHQPVIKEKSNSASASSTIVDAKAPFRSKAEIFEFIKGYTQHPSSIKKSDKINAVIDKIKLCTDLEKSCGISIWTRIPQIQTIGNLIDAIWSKSSQR